MFVDGPIEAVTCSGPHSRRSRILQLCNDVHQDLPVQTAWLESVGGDSKPAPAVTIYDLLDRRRTEDNEPAELDEVARAAATRFEVRAEIARDAQAGWAGRKRRKEVMQLALADVSLLLRENFAHGEHGLVALELTFD